MRGLSPTRRRSCCRKRAPGGGRGATAIEPAADFAPSGYAPCSTRGYDGPAPTPSATPSSARNRPLWRSNDELSPPCRSGLVASAVRRRRAVPPHRDRRPVSGRGTGDGAGRVPAAGWDRLAAVRQPDGEEARIPPRIRAGAEPATVPLSDELGSRVAVPRGADRHRRTDPGSLLRRRGSAPDP